MKIKKSNVQVAAEFALTYGDFVSTTELSEGLGCDRKLASQYLRGFRDSSRFECETKTEEYILAGVPRTRIFVRVIAINEDPKQAMPVIGTSLHDKTVIKYYPSVGATETDGFNKTSVMRAAIGKTAKWYKGREHEYGGFKWEFAEVVE